VETPAKKLAGFARVTLKAEEQKVVKINVDPIAVSYWDEDAHKWVAPVGCVPVYVGSSSADIAVTGTLRVR